MMGQEVYEVQKVVEDVANGVLTAEPMHRLYVGHSEWSRSEWSSPKAGYRCLRHKVNGANGVETVIVWSF